MNKYTVIEYFYASKSWFLQDIIGRYSPKGFALHIEQHAS